jgi:predicted acylesterase/phospholipase RssA
MTSPASGQALTASTPTTSAGVANGKWVTPEVPARLNRDYQKDELCRVLSLDGGGAKGFYTLGALRALEDMLGCPLYKRFDLIFGTSTGAIIAALLALGCDVETIHETYKAHVPGVMGEESPEAKTAALKRLAEQVFKDAAFTDVKTRVGIVATKWVEDRPMIFKADVAQAHGSHGSFKPGFGVSIAEAVQASCSAYPFFKRKFVHTADGDDFELIDGGFCANNPTLYAIADANVALKKARSELRVLSIGVGVYPQPTPGWRDLLTVKHWKGKAAKSLIDAENLVQKTLEINTQSMDQLQTILFRDVPTVRINQTFSEPQMATDFMERDLAKLNLLRQRGRNTFAAVENNVKNLLAGAA